MAGGNGLLQGAGWWEVMQLFLQEQFKLCSIDLQTEEMLRLTAWHTDHLGFSEALAWTGLGL